MSNFSFLPQIIKNHSEKYTPIQHAMMFIPFCLDRRPWFFIKPLFLVIYKDLEFNLRSEVTDLFLAQKIGEKYKSVTSNVQVQTISGPSAAARTC